MDIKLGKLTLHIHKSWFVLIALVIAITVLAPQSLQPSVIEFYSSLPYYKLALVCFGFFTIFVRAFAQTIKGVEEDRISIMGPFIIAHFDYPYKKNDTEAMIAARGIIAHVINIIFIVALGIIASTIGGITGTIDTVSKVFEDVMLITTSVFILSLIPIFPMSGARILRCFLMGSFRYDPFYATKSTLRFGYIIMFAIAMITLHINPSQEYYYAIFSLLCILFITSKMELHNVMAKEKVIAENTCFSIMSKLDKFENNLVTVKPNEKLHAGCLPWRKK